MNILVIPVIVRIPVFTHIHQDNLLSRLSKCNNQNRCEMVRQPACFLDMPKLKIPDHQSAHSLFSRRTVRHAVPGVRPSFASSPSAER